MNIFALTWKIVPPLHSLTLEIMMQVKDLLRTLQLVDPELTVYTTERDYQLESPNAVAIDLTHKQLIIGQTSYWTPDKKYDTVIYSEES